MSFLDINDKVLLFLSARSGRLEEEGITANLVSTCISWLEEIWDYMRRGNPIDKKDTLHVWKFDKKSLPVTLRLLNCSFENALLVPPRWSVISMLSALLATSLYATATLSLGVTGTCQQDSKVPISDQSHSKAALCHSRSPMHAPVACIGTASWRSSHWIPHDDVAVCLGLLVCTVITTQQQPREE